MQSCYPLNAFAFIAAAFAPSRHPVLSQVDILIGADFQRPACHAGIEASRIKKFVTFPFLSFHQSPLELPMIHVHRGSRSAAMIQPFRSLNACGRVEQGSTSKAWKIH